jgi:hypothetical protein
MFSGAGSTCRRLRAPEVEAPPEGEGAISGAKRVVSPPKGSDFRRRRCVGGADRTAGSVMLNADR